MSGIMAYSGSGQSPGVHRTKWRKHFIASPSSHEPLLAVEMAANSTLNRQHDQLCSYYLPRSVVQFKPTCHVMGDSDHRAVSQCSPVCLSLTYHALLMPLQATLDSSRLLPILLIEHQ